jgi:hypothetical protein
MVAGRIRDGAAQPAHLDDRRIHAAFLTRAHRHQTAQTGRQAQRRVHTQQGAVGPGADGRDQRPVVQRHIAGPGKQAHHRHAVVAALENGQGGLLALAAAQVDADETFERC